MYRLKFNSVQTMNGKKAWLRRRTEKVRLAETDCAPPCMCIREFPSEKKDGSPVTDSAGLFYRRMRDKFKVDPWCKPPLNAEILCV